MLDESDSVASLQRRLLVHRRTIELLELQRSKFGAFTPIYIWHQFDDTRTEIARIKQDLRALGVAIDDHPNDIAPPSNEADQVPVFDTDSMLQIYRGMLVDQVRYLQLPGARPHTDIQVDLASVYVERELIQLESPRSWDMHAPQSPSPSPSITLASLVSTSGARIVLEGPPFSGRTLCLHRLALACAASAGGHVGASASADLVADWPAPVPLPILLDAREIAATLTHAGAAPDIGLVPAPAVFWSAIERWLRYSDLDSLVPTLQQQLERGGCLVMIDNIDEFSDSAGLHSYITALSRFVTRFPENRYIITCRSFDPATMAPLASFARYRLAPLDALRIDTMIERWYHATGDRLGAPVAEDISERIMMLQGALQGDAGLRELLSSPMALVVVILLHVEGYCLPGDRGVVMQRLLDTLCGRAEFVRQHTRGLHNTPRADPAMAGNQQALLEPLALAFQARLQQDNDTPQPLSYVEIKALLSESMQLASVERRVAGKDITPQLLGWCTRTGLLMQAGAAAYTMPQRVFREYLAARALARQADFVQRAYQLRDDPRWRGTLLMAVQSLGRSSALSSVHEFLMWLLESPAPLGERERDLLLAAECLAELGERALPERALRTVIQERLLRLLELPDQPPDQRIRAGVLLGRLGDPRFEGLLPPLASVAAGPFILGSDQGYPDEGPVQRVDVPTFAIGIYPVTNREYSAFLAENLAYPRPRYWYDTRYNNPSSPVVGVTWYDARAYCSWLQSRLSRSGLLAPGMVVRLPREVEWEKASSWDLRRLTKLRYPWGDAWDSRYANTADARGNWTTAPVGCYPGGVSPYGLHDCVGNVWEWMIDTYASYPGSTAPFHESDHYVLRGSSCASNPTHTRSTYRSRLPPGYWRYHLGFRIVIGPALV